MAYLLPQYVLDMGWVEWEPLNPIFTRRGPSQDAPFDIILWYIAKKSYFVVIEPVFDVELTCIF